MIEIRDVSHAYGATPVLSGVSLRVETGEFLSLVGPSGCGKSTLLRIVAGLLAQDRGSIAIGGRPVDGCSPKDRDIAMVFQNYALYPQLTVFGNIALPLRMRRLSLLGRTPLLHRLHGPSRRARAAIAQEVRAVAETLSIGHLVDRRPGQLSGGQRQRVALGRALVRRPTAFLMDEPLSNLDAELRVQMRSEIAQLHRRLGSTVIYVTHDQVEAMTMSTKVAVMMEGRVLQVASPAEIYGRPNSLRVARFIGSPRLNVFPAQIAPSGELRVAGVPAGRCDARSLGAGTASVGIRPEDMRLAAAGSPDLLTLQVAHVENLGADRLVYLRHDRLAGEWVARTGADHAGVEAGASVGLNVAVSRRMIFTPEGERLDPVPETAAA